MQSQNRIPMISLSVNHFESKHGVSTELVDLRLENLRIKTRIGTQRKLADLSEQLDNRITLRSAMFWIKQQRLQIEVLGKIIVE